MDKETTFKMIVIVMLDKRRLDKNAKSRAKYHERRKDPEFVEYHRKRTREYNKTEKGRAIQNQAMREWRHGMTDEEKAAFNARQRKWANMSYDRLKQDPEWLDSRRKKANAYAKNKKRADPNFRMAHNYRTRISVALTGREKFGGLDELIGCTIEELRAHLEKQFVDGMSWANYGNGIGKWNLDHITPIAAHDLSDVAQQKAAFHYTNTQPMWYVDNCSKNSIVDGVKQYYC